MRSRLQERLGLPDKEWDKYRIATVIQGKPHYVEDQQDKIINLKVLIGVQYGGSIMQLQVAP